MPETVMSAEVASSTQTSTFPTVLSRIKATISSRFTVQEVIVDVTSYRFYVADIGDTKSPFLDIHSQLGLIGFVPILRRVSGRLLLVVVPKRVAGKDIWFVNLALFAATVVTTSMAGYGFSLQAGIDPMIGAISFSASILGIMGAHELGHKFMAVRRGVDASYPYFIPMPIFLGTLGAIIRLRSPSKNRDTLFDVGATGPIAGFIVALPTAAIGILLSHPVPAEAVKSANLISLPPILVWLTHALIPNLPPNSLLSVHPVALAAWVGILITFLNLMPAGQLDGGHIVRTLVGPTWHKPISLVAALATFLLGYTFMSLLMLWFSMTVHVGPLDDVSPLSKKRRICTIGIFMIMLVSATPVSFGVV